MNFYSEMQKLSTLLYDIKRSYNKDKIDKAYTIAEGICRSTHNLCGAMLSYKLECITDEKNYEYEKNYLDKYFDEMQTFNDLFQGLEDNGKSDSYNLFLAGSKMACSAFIEEIDIIEDFEGIDEEIDNLIKEIDNLKFDLKYCEDNEE